MIVLISLNWDNEFSTTWQQFLFEFEIAIENRLLTRTKCGWPMLNWLPQREMLNLSNETSVYLSTEMSAKLKESITDYFRAFECYFQRCTEIHMQNYTFQNLNMLCSLKPWADTKYRTFFWYENGHSEKKRVEKVFERRRREAKKLARE